MSTAFALRRPVKRAIDLMIATTASIALSPVIVAVAAVVRWRMGSPVLYGQWRVGYLERHIRVWKFRTMTEARSPDGSLLPDGQRLTPTGRWLRERSLDELPQLLNILNGTMSVVGPRPLLIRYIPRYTARQRVRHSVKPGVTGWAQVHGRNGLDWETRLALDVWYAEHWSLLLDLKVIARTVISVLRRESVFAGAGEELSEFWGTQPLPADGTRAFPVEADEGQDDGRAH